MKKFSFLLLSIIFISYFILSSYDHKPIKNHALYKIMQTEKFDEPDREKILYIDVGIDYLPPDVIEVFEELTGIKVVVDIFDSNEILEGKILAGGGNYDIVFPTAWPNFSRQLKADVYQKIDKSKIDYKIFDPYILEKLAISDKGNKYAIPYQWGVSGIGINKNFIKSLGAKFNFDSLGIIFDPKNAKLLSKYRICVYASPNELFPEIQAYLKLPPDSKNIQDIKKAANHLRKIRKYISKFTSYGFEDLASKNACAVLGTSGDIKRVCMQEKTGNIKFIFPKEGTALWLDVIAIPKGAQHFKNIYIFLKFLFHPAVIAHITNETFRANAVILSKDYLSPSIASDSDIYPLKETLEKCYIEEPLSPDLETVRMRLLTKIKSFEHDKDEGDEEC